MKVINTRIVDLCRQLSVLWMMFFLKKKDNIALIERVLKKEDALFDNKEAMSNGIENFFKTQVTVFDQAVQFEKCMMTLTALQRNEKAHKALNTIRLITMVRAGSKFSLLGFGTESADGIRFVPPMTRCWKKNVPRFWKRSVSVWRQPTLPQMAIPRHRT